MWRIGVAVSAAAFIGLVACTQDPQSLENERKVDAGEIILSGTAPDGTKLWETIRHGRRVYFSSTGTSTTETAGKSTRDIEVPNTQPTIGN